MATATAIRQTEGDSGPLTIEVPRGARQLTLLNPGQVANIYNVSKEEVYEALREERLPFHRLGRWNYLLVYEDLPEKFPFADESGSRPTPYIGPLRKSAA